MSAPTLTRRRPSTEAHLAALTAHLEDHHAVAVLEGRPRWRIAATARRDDLGPALDAVAELRGRADVYVSTVALDVDRVAELRRRGSRGGAVDAVAVLGTYADLDVAGENHKTTTGLPPDLDTARGILDDLPEPSLTISTGGGLHAWWLLDRPALVTDDTRDDLAQLVRGWDRTVAHHAHRRGFRTDAVGELARVLRLCGTINHKRGDATEVELLDVGGWPAGGLIDHGSQWRPDAVYSRAELVEHLDPLEVEPTRPQRSTPATAPRPLLQRDRTGGKLNILDAVKAATWDEIWPDDWDHVGDATVNGERVELWRRPGATSAYSARCWPDEGCMLWSDAVPGLHGGAARGRYSKVDVIAWRLGIGLPALSRLIITEARALGVLR